MKKILNYLFIAVLGISQAQVLIDDTGTATEPHESAVLDLQSSDKGLLLPRLSSPPSGAVAGLIYWDTSGNCFRGYNGSTWNAIGAECDFGPINGYYNDFDTNTTWNYTASPTPYNVGDDVWDKVNALNSINTLSGNFWGMRDLENSNGGGDFKHILTFEEKDISGRTNVVFKFDYQSIGMNVTSDRYGYELFYDNISQGEVDICKNCDSAKSGTITVSVPDNVNSFSVIIYGNFDGNTDIAAVDNFSLTF